MSTSAFMQPNLKSSSRSNSSTVVIPANTSEFDALWKNCLADAVRHRGRSPVGEGWKRYDEVKEMMAPLGEEAVTPKERIWWRRSGIGQLRDHENAPQKTTACFCR